MKSRKNSLFLVGVLFSFFMSYHNVFAADTYTINDYAYFDPISNNACNESNYWTIYNQTSTCYRFIVLNPSDSGSETTIKLLLDHDLGEGTFDNATSVLNSSTANWSKYPGTVSLPDEDTIATLMKLGSNRPDIVDGVPSSINGGVPLYNLATNTYYVLGGTVHNDNGYWVSGSTSNSSYAYMISNKANNTLGLKTESRGIRPMIVVSKGLLTKSSSPTNLSDAIRDAAEFKYSGVSQGGLLYKSLQGFAVNNSTLLFNAYNSSNSNSSLLVPYSGSNNSYTVIGDVIYDTVGKGNAMTYNSKNNTFLVGGANNYSEIYEYDANTFDKINTYDVSNSKYSSLGYDSFHDYYVGQVDRRVFITNNNFEQLYSFDVPHYLTSQDLAYSNGYVYYVTSDAGEPNDYQLYGFTKDSALIYAYNAKFNLAGNPEKDFGRLEKVFYIDNINRSGLGGTGQLEGISFNSGLAWLGYNASSYDSNDVFKFYRADFTNFMISPSCSVSYNEGDMHTTVTISCNSQLYNLAGWTKSSDKYSLSKTFNDKKAASRVQITDNYGNTGIIDIRELTTQKTDISFPDAAIEREYTVGTFSYPASTESNGTITYSTDNDSVATVDNTGKVTIHAMGIATITASITKGDGYYKGSASYVLTVKKCFQDLSFNQTSVPKTYGDEPFTITASRTLGDGVITYSSSDVGVATVDNTGKVTIHGAGEAVITATAAATSGFEEANASYTLNVAKKPQSISFANSSISKYTGAEAFTEVAILSDGDGNITYSSSNTDVATVDNSGLVTVVGVGDTTITAVASETSNYSSSYASYGLSVYQKNAQTLSFDNTNVVKTYGDSAFTNAVHHDTGDGTISYTSSDTSVATVTSAGKVTILKAGNTVITAIASETGSYARTTASYSLTIQKKEQAIAFPKSSESKKFTDDKFTLKAVLTDGDGSITYRSVDERVATVDLSGKVTIKNVGTTTIMATAAETDNYLITSTSYTLTVTKGNQVIFKDSVDNEEPIKVLDSVKPFKLEVQHEVGDGDLSYSSSNQEVATIDDEALVTVVAPGTTTLTVVAEETEQYLSQVYSKVLVVEETPASPVTSTDGIVNEVVHVENTGIMRHFPIISIGLILLGLYYLYRQEFIFIKNKKSSRN